MADILKKNNTLQTLDIPYNKISNEGGKAATEMLKANTTLRTLTMSYNKIGATCMMLVRYDLTT